MQRKLGKLIPAAILAACLAAPALGAGVEPAEPKGDDPAAKADLRFNEGLGHRDVAWRLTKKLESATPDERAKLERDIRAAYESAVRDFEAAIAIKPDHHKALGSLGYALRQLGDYDKALEAYDQALALDPDYTNAIEYRGEAYLGLNRINEAQNAYRVLTAKDADLAAELLGAMQSWVAARKSDPAGVAPEQIDGFARWVSEREQVAKTSSTYKSRSW